ncbi:MAG: hypothetical protein ACYSTX_04320, partial [Planctomycetota bacterium]
SSEVLQRIAEDLDNIITADLETTITINNKFDQGYQTSRMIIEKKFYDDNAESQTFEKIVWQSKYDFESPVPGLVIYRSHSGIILEDKLLDKQKETWESELFVPVCEGVTLFKIEAIKNKRAYDNWETNDLPYAVVATISFAEPFETLEGTLDLFEEDKTKRTIAIDRTRRMSFTYVTQYEINLDETKDVNEITENTQDANDVK